MYHNEHGLTKTCTKCNLISIEEKVKVKKAKRKAFSKKFNEFIKSTYTPQPRESISMAVV